MLITKNPTTGFITHYYLYDDLKNNPALISSILATNCWEECPDFPPDQEAAWEHFKANYTRYTFHPVSPEYWTENFGPGYEIPSEDIVSQFHYHPEET